MSKPKRARTERRAADRTSKKDRDAIARLYALSPGGSPDRSIEVASPSVVEGDAIAKRCPFCDAPPKLVEPHDVVEHQGRRLRRAKLVCPMCRASFERFYSIGPLLS